MLIGKICFGINDTIGRLSLITKMWDAYYLRNFV